MKKEKKPWLKKLAYEFDEYMAKGTRTQFILLLIIFLIIICLCGPVVRLLSGNTDIRAGMWQTLMHLIDQGTITGDELDNDKYLLIMLIITICGMVLTGTLIAIINNALSTRLTNLKKGSSQIIERGHTIVIGFDENIYCILRELTEANKNLRKRACIVVIDEKTDKEVMDKLISDNVDRDKKTKIICRTGVVAQNAIYRQISLENAGAILINYDDDFQVLRVLLAVTAYLKQRKVFSPVITTLLHEEKSIVSARYVIKDFPNAKILYFEDMLARIMAQVCRQPGLSMVLSTIFGYNDNEFYFEGRDKYGAAFPIEGRAFSEILYEFSNTTVIGIERNGKAVINPPPDTLLEKGDLILHLAYDDNETIIRENNVNLQACRSGMKPAGEQNRKPSKFLILDWNNSLPTIIRVLNDLVNEGSSALIVSDREYSKKLINDFTALPNIRVEFKKERHLFAFETLKNLLNEKYTNILLVCEDGIDKNLADEQTAMLLLHLRAVINAEETGDYSNLIITSEMNTADDQNLLQVANVNDFVVGSEIANRIMTQVANQPRLAEVFSELLDAEGSEIYLRSAAGYIAVGSELSFADVTYIIYNYTEYNGEREHAIPLGYRYPDKNGDYVIELNPHKSSRHLFTEDDMLIVLSKGRKNILRENRQ